MEALLKLENISKRYGRETVLKDVDLELKSGEIVGLVGPNGAGKSTIMKIISGLISNYEGTAQINGENIRDMKCRSKKVGCLIEEPGFYGDDTGFDKFEVLRQTFWSIFKNTDNGSCKAHRHRQCPEKARQQVFSGNETKTGNLYGNGRQPGDTGP